MTISDERCDEIRDVAWVESGRNPEYMPRISPFDYVLIRHARAESAQEIAELRAALTETNRYWAESVAGRATAEAALAEARKDAERLDWIELCIRDGSYASVINDIIAVCQHAYNVFGPGPAIRSTIDSLRVDIIDAAREGKA